MKISKSIMRLLSIISLFFIGSFAYGQKMPVCSGLEKINVSVNVEVDGSRLTSSISKKQLIEKGFVLKVENAAYKITGFVVVIPCQTDFLITDVSLRRFIGNVAPPNDRGLRLLKVGDNLAITCINLGDNGCFYLGRGVSFIITE